MKTLKVGAPIKIYFGSPGNWQEAQGVTITSMTMVPKAQPIKIKDLYPGWKEPRYFRYMRWIAKKKEAQ